MSVVVIVGGDGKHAVTKLVATYPQMDAEAKAAAVALLQTFIDDVDSLCANVDHDGQQDDGDRAVNRADPNFDRDPEDPERRREHWRIMDKPDDECDSYERAYKKSYTLTLYQDRSNYE